MPIKRRRRPPDNRCTNRSAALRVMAPMPKADAGRRCSVFLAAIVVLNNGQTVRADEGYLRESIMNPQAKIVTGFGPIMPSFQGQVNEEQFLSLVAYVKSLSTTQA